MPFKSFKVKVFIELGVRKERYFQKPLHKAAFRGHIEVVQHLLDVGANIDSGNGDGFRELLKMLNPESLRY